MITPTVHMNGTSGEVLLAQLETAWRALDDALSAVAEAGPNARDYPQGPDAAQKAGRDHGDRIKTLRAMRDDMMSARGAVQDQLDERDARRMVRAGKVAT